MPVCGTGYPQLTTFQVLNNGTDVLNVSDVTTTDPALVVEESPGPTGDGTGITSAFPLPPGGATFHSCRTLHYTAANTSAVPRRAFTTIVHGPKTAREVPIPRTWLAGAYG